MRDVTDIERIAALIDPAVWAEQLPIPTRADTIDWHQRRQASAGIAKAIIAEITLRSSPAK